MEEKSHSLIEIILIIIALGFIAIITYVSASYSGRQYAQHYHLIVNTSDDRYLTFEDVTHLIISDRNISFQYKDDDYAFHNIRGYQKHPLDE